MSLSSLGLAFMLNSSSFASPQYYEIWKHGEVIGISLTFMVVDLLGGLFSDLSLAFKKDLDVIAAITYSIVVVSELKCARL